MNELAPVPTHPFSVHGMRERWEAGHLVIDRLINHDLQAEGIDNDGRYFAEVRRAASHARLDTMLGISHDIWLTHVEMGGELSSPKIKAIIEFGSTIRADREARKRRSTFELLVSKEEIDQKEGDE